MEQFLQFFLFFIVNKVSEECRIKKLKNIFRSWKFGLINGDQSLNLINLNTQYSHAVNKITISTLSSMIPLFRITSRHNSLVSDSIHVLNFSRAFAGFISVKDLHNEILGRFFFNAIQTQKPLISKVFERFKHFKERSTFFQIYQTLMMVTKREERYPTILCRAPKMLTDFILDVF